MTPAQQLLDAYAQEPAMFYVDADTTRYDLAPRAFDALRLVLSHLSDMEEAAKIVVESSSEMGRDRSKYILAKIDRLREIVHDEMLETVPESLLQEFA